MSTDFRSKTRTNAAVRFFLMFSAFPSQVTGGRDLYRTSWTLSTVYMRLLPVAIWDWEGYPLLFRRNSSPQSQFKTGNSDFWFGSATSKTLCNEELKRGIGIFVPLSPNLGLESLPDGVTSCAFLSPAARGLVFISHGICLPSPKLRLEFSPADPRE
jgi:hypothetical protein